MTKLYTDTSANLPLALLREYDIAVIPFSYTVNGVAEDYNEETDFDGKAFYDAMRRGDASAKAVVDGYVHYLCVGITSIVNIFQPEVLCVGGGISREGEAVMAPVRAYVGKYGYARGSAKQPRIVAASLAGDAGIIGAALLGTEKK